MRSMAGLFPPPREEPCDDPLCPWHGKERALRVHGRIFKGKVISYKRIRTVTVLIEYIRRDPKYKRFYRCHTKLHAHVPGCLEREVEEGDTVIIAETRPISKTKRFVVVAIVEKARKK